MDLITSNPGSLTDHWLVKPKPDIPPPDDQIQARWNNYVFYKDGSVFYGNRKLLPTIAQHMRKLLHGVRL